MPLYRTNTAAYMGDLLTRHGASQAAGRISAGRDANAMRLAGKMRMADTIGQLAGLPMQYQQQQQAQRATAFDEQVKMADLLGKQQDRALAQDRHRLAEDQWERRSRSMDVSDDYTRTMTGVQEAARRSEEEKAADAEMLGTKFRELGGDIDAVSEWARVNGQSGILRDVLEMERNVYQNESMRADMNDDALQRIVTAHREGRYRTDDDWRRARESAPESIRAGLPGRRPGAEWGMDLVERANLDRLARSEQVDLMRIDRMRGEDNLKAWGAYATQLSASQTLEEFQEETGTLRRMRPDLAGGLDAIEGFIGERGIDAAREYASSLRGQGEERWRSLNEARAHQAHLYYTGETARATELKGILDRMEPADDAEEGAGPDLKRVGDLVDFAAKEVSDLASDVTIQIKPGSYDALYGQLSTASRYAAGDQAVQPVKDMVPVIMEAATAMGGAGDLVIAYDPMRRAYMPMTREQRQAAAAPDGTLPPELPLSSQIIGTALDIARFAQRRPDDE